MLGLVAAFRFGLRMIVRAFGLEVHFAAAAAPKMRDRIATVAAALLYDEMSVAFAVEDSRKTINKLQCHLNKNRKFVFC